MRTLAVIASLLTLLCYSCEKEEGQKVRYQVTRSVSGFNVNYLNGEGILIRDTVTTQSAQDIWRFDFEAEPGEVVFISTRYTDITSAIKVQILIDGKVYKEGSSTNDTVSFVTVSGTVPY